LEHTYEYCYKIIINRKLDPNIRIYKEIINTGKNCRPFQNLSIQALEFFLFPGLKPPGSSMQKTRPSMEDIKTIRKMDETPFKTAS
jgi:hypothetical protein